MSESNRRVLGSYELLIAIAESPGRRIWLGRDVSDASGEGEPVLVVLRPAALGDPERLERIRTLSHPAILRVRAAQVEGDELIVVHDYVHGFDLDVWRRYLEGAHRHPPFAVWCHVVASVLEGLQHAHQGVTPLVHGTLTPEDVLVDVEGRVHLIGFDV
ncbi:MAG: hypothetical protein OEY14_03670, partial [Myxococcales bacterium]|nr:hypothetical protein [Myxococcales bacterium]